MLGDYNDDGNKAFYTLNRYEEDKNNASAQIGSRNLNESYGGITDPSIPYQDQNVNQLAYGESALSNRTRRGMLADNLERFGNMLEGAQTNVTRAAAKDLGIESTGKVVENVRKRTGITNLDTQAKLKMSCDNI